MEQIVTRLLEDFEQGKMSRRQLIQNLALTAAAASAASLLLIWGDAKTSFHILDPDGFEVQFGGLRQ